MGGEEIYEEVVREGKWVCPNCGSENPGSSMKCPGCGQTREEVDFIYDEEGRTVTDEDELREALDGPDWICAYCDTSNRHSDQVCSQCGAPRDGRSRKVEEIPVESEGDGSRDGDEGGWGLRGLLVFGGAGLAILLILGWLFGGTRARLATVEKVRWSRALGVERYERVTEKAWRDDVPAGATIISSRREIYGYTKVRTGTKTVTRKVPVKVKEGYRRVKVKVVNLGNGRFKEIYKRKPIYKTVYEERKEEVPVYERRPIYKDKVTYSIMKWVEKRRLEKSGEAPSEPSWPEFAPSSSDERAGRKYEKYVFELKGDDGARYEYVSTSYDDYRRCPPGARVRLYLRYDGSIERMEKAE